MSLKQVVSKESLQKVFTLVNTRISSEVSKLAKSNHTHSVFKGATASANGTTVFVPAPSGGGSLNS